MKILFSKVIHLPVVQNGRESFGRPTIGAMLATARFDLSLLDSLIPRRAVLDLSELGCKVIVVDIEGRQIRSILLSTDGKDKRQEVSLDGLIDCALKVVDGSLQWSSSDHTSAVSRMIF